MLGNSTGRTRQLGFLTSNPTAALLRQAQTSVQALRLDTIPSGAALQQQDLQSPRRPSQPPEWVKDQPLEISVPLALLH